MDTIHLQYPIGEFRMPENIDEKRKAQAIDTIRTFPEKIAGYTGPELNYLKPYRTGGWNLKQLIHHLADSHMNAFIRFKLALTETSPVIKPYNEGLWAELSDYNLASVGESYTILSGLHSRWSVLLENMTNRDFQRQYFHPQSGSLVKLQEALFLYEWHCLHHFEHILLTQK